MAIWIEIFFQKMNFLHPVDPGIPEGPDLTLALHLTHEKSGPDPDTGDSHASLMKAW